MRTGTITLESGVSDSSDSGILVDACLARLRKTAGLDIEPVLPPLQALLGEPTTAKIHPPPLPPRAVVPPQPGPTLAPIPTPPPIPTLGTIPTPAAPVRASSIAPAPASKRRTRWPVILCAFIAGTFGGVAVMKSPIGQKPAVQHVVKVAKRQVVHATDAAKSFIESHA